MLQSPKKSNDFNDKLKVATITAVYPQTKTVDIKYLSQAGTYNGLHLPSNITGLTYGINFMPVIGDRVLVDTLQGDRPVIQCMYPTNANYLPYLDPGEMSFMTENGSYIHAKAKRKRSISTNQLLDYNATEGPAGPNDMEYEPGGITIRARSKKDRDGQVPRWDNHSFLSLFDNGDVAIQAMYQDVPKGLLYMCGASGYVFLKSGNGILQEYIELNPAKKEMVLLSDGEIHTWAQTNYKQSVLGNMVYNIGQGLQITLGQSLATIPANFDEVIANNVSQGDIYITNTNTSGSGKMTLNLKGDFDVTVNEGSVNLIANGNVNIQSSSGVYLQGPGGGSDPVITKSFFDGHVHGPGPPDHTSPPIEPAPDRGTYA